MKPKKVRLYRRFIYNGVEYPSVNALAKILDCSPQAIYHNLNLGRFAVNGIPFEVKEESGHNLAAAKPVKCLETGKQYESCRRAADDHCLAAAGIVNVLKGRQKTAGGFHWEYVR